MAGAGRRRPPRETPEQTRARVERRRASVPELRYPAALPVAERREEILAALAENQVLVVAGETGSGKTTQLPKIALELGRGVNGMIGHTQPRRIAARTVAERIAEELDVPLGGAVGYAIRFRDEVGPDTLVKVMTDGILLAELQRDRELLRYDTIIVDEAHERSLNIDFILGYLKALLPRRPDLKVIVTSATIDTDRFSQHFSAAPVIEVSGRTYPVEIRYRPPGEVVLEGEDKPEADEPRPASRSEGDQVQAVGDAVAELCREGPGDILVFLSGEREIRDTADFLRRLELTDTEIAPLYARLSAAEQHRVFQAHRGRRVVLATNVAETSITVPGIRYVVDTGTARISRYNRRTKVQRLPIEPVSKASANQRAGRCGRLGPGICIRLYSEKDFQGRPDYTDPEILRTNLAAVILQMTAIGLGDIASFPFVDPPDARNIRDGVALLEELGALQPDKVKGRSRLTETGRRLAALPVDPRLGRMVLEAERNGCFREVVVVTAALSIQDPRERPSERRQAADEAHARFRHPDSDFLSYLNLWQYLQEKQAELSSNQFRKLCRSEYLNYQRVREWQDICSQLRQVGRELGIRPQPEPAQPDVVHRSLLAGLLSHIGMRDPVRQDYLGARNAHFAVAPGSTLFKRSPRWVMAAELVETNRLWARTASRIQPEWAEILGRDLLEYSYSDPQWDPRRGSAVAMERATLYGLPVVSNRRVPYARLDPAWAREMFIRHALMEGDWAGAYPFVEHNQSILEEARALEEKSRRSDLLVEEEALFDFFDQRLGPEVVSVRSFDGWWRRQREQAPNLLDLSLDLLLRPGAHLDPADYPEQWEADGISLLLSYEVDPAAPGDGVNVHIPLPLLGQVSGSGFDWQVPGLRWELVTALIRALPKNLRRNFVPAPDYAGAFLDRNSPPDGPLLEVLAHHLSAQAGVPVGAGDFNLETIPPHLLVSFVIEDSAGQVVAAGKDLEQLRTTLAGRARRAVAEAIGRYQRDGLTDWTVGTLPRVVEESWEGQLVRAYPALVDRGESVSVRLFSDPAQQSYAMRTGLRRLLLLNAPGVTRALRSLSNQTKLAISQSPYLRVADLLADAAALAVDELIDAAGGLVWDREGYDRLLGQVRADVPRSVLATVKRVGVVLDHWRRVRDRLERLPPSLRETSEDVVDQLEGLVHDRFVAYAGTHLTDYPRYLSGMERRLDKAGESPSRDAARAATVRQLSDQLARLSRGRQSSPEVRRVRWMLEELRISLFAQVLGTPQPVSVERVHRALEGLAR